MSKRDFHPDFCTDGHDFEAHPGPVHSSRDYATWVSLYPCRSCPAVRVTVSVEDPSNLADEPFRDWLGEAILDGGTLTRRD